MDLGWSAVFPFCFEQLKPTAETGSGEWGDAQPQKLGVGQSSNSFRTRTEQLKTLLLQAMSNSLWRDMGHHLPKMSFASCLSFQDWAFQLDPGHALSWTSWLLSAISSYLFPFPCNGFLVLLVTPKLEFHLAPCCLQPCVQQSSVQRNSLKSG